MVVPTISAFTATTSGEIYTKVSGGFTLHFVCLCKTCVYFRYKLIKGQGPFIIFVCVSIGEILIVPNVVIVVAFNVSCLLFQFRDLTTSRSLHPFMNLKSLLVFKHFQLGLFLKLCLLLLILICCLFGCVKLGVHIFKSLPLQLFHFRLVSLVVENFFLD